MGLTAVAGAETDTGVWTGPRPSRAPRVTTGCGWIYVIIVRDPETHDVSNVFIHAGKEGGCASAQTEAACRLITRAIEAGDDIQSVADQLAGIKCNRPGWDGPVEIGSCADAIAHAITMDALAEVEYGPCYCPVDDLTGATGHTTQP